MTPQQILADLRDAGQRRDAARARLAHDSHSPADPARANLRARVGAALITSLRPTDHAVARWLLGQEVAAHAAAGQGAGEMLYALVAAVARFADPADALLLWQAHEATPETRAGVDVEQLARAGVERVRVRLRSLAAEGGEHGTEAARALAWFDEGLAQGALDDLPSYFAWSDERFGLLAEGPV